MSGLLMGQIWGLEIDGREREVLLAMADHAHDDGSACYPSIPKLAWKVGVSERTVQRIIGQMVKSEVLEMVRDASHHRAREYRIDLSALRSKPQLWGDRGDRGDKSGVTGVTKTGGRGDIQGVTLTIENHPIEPTTANTDAPAAEQDTAETAEPTKRTRKPGPWDDFRATVLESYGQAESKRGHSMITLVINTAKVNGLDDPERARRAWSRWRRETTADNTARYFPLHLAAEGFGAWCKAMRDRHGGGS